MHGCPCAVTSARPRRLPRHRARLALVLAGGIAGLRQLALAPQVLLGDERLGFVGVIRLERGAGGIRANLVEREVGRISSCSRSSHGYALAAWYLQKQPWAMARLGSTFALGIDARGEVALREVRPS